MCVCHFDFSWTSLNLHHTKKNFARSAKCHSLISNFFYYFTLVNYFRISSVCADRLFLFCRLLINETVLERCEVECELSRPAEYATLFFFCCSLPYISFTCGSRALLALFTLQQHTTNEREKLHSYTSDVFWGEQRACDGLCAIASEVQMKLFPKKRVDEHHIMLPLETAERWCNRRRSLKDVWDVCRRESLMQNSGGEREEISDNTGETSLNFPGDDEPMVWDETNVFST